MPSPSSILATYPFHLIPLDLITCTIVCEQYRSLSFSLWSFLHSPVTSSLLGSNILLNTLLSKTLSLSSSPSVRDQVSHPYKTTGKIIVLYTFKFLDSKPEDKRFCTEWQQAFPFFNLPLISFWIEFWFVRVVTKYWNPSTLPKELLSIFILWLHHEFWSQDTTMYLVLSAFTSSPISTIVCTGGNYSVAIC
jgi:hypothetical protein